MKVSRRAAVFVTAAVVLALVLCGTVLKLNDGSLDLSGREVRLIVTDSMDGEPTGYRIDTIPKGSLVMVRHVDMDEIPLLEQGEVIQFRQGNILNHHRLVENNVAEHYVITKGDNAPLPETEDYSKVTGVVVGYSHVIGPMVGFVKDYWMFLIGAIVCLFVASSLIREIRKEQGDPTGSGPDHKEME